MHEEWFEITEETANIINNRQKRLIIVGTTSVRALESATDDLGIVKPITKTTDIFIYPGYAFRAVDAMVTNFHLPKSTLLMLVSAYFGRKRVLEAYETANEKGYRFYSLGDAMLLIKKI